MNNNDKTDFFAALEAAFEIYGKSLSTAAGNLYFETLSRFELNDVLRALSAHIRNPDNGQFTPKPADIIRILDGDTQVAGLNAWTKVVKAIRSVGPYCDVVFDDPVIHSVIRDMGGWIDLNNVMEDELPFKSNEFVKRYRGGLSPFASNDYPKILTGISNAHNQLAGHKACKPVLIGCEEKARLVYRGGSFNSGPSITRFPENAGQPLLINQQG